MKIRIHPAIKTEKQSAESLLLDSLLFGSAVQEVITIYFFDFPYKNAYAKGFNLEGGFLVLKGSWAAKCESNKLTVSHKRLRKKLLEDGVIEVREFSLAFKKPYLFRNEYEATCIISGNNKYRKHSGIWRDQHGRTPLENRLIGIIEMETTGMR